MPDTNKSLLVELYQSRAHAVLTLENIEKTIKKLETDKPKRKKTGLPESELARIAARRKKFLLNKTYK